MTKEKIINNKQKSKNNKRKKMFSIIIGVVSVIFVFGTFQYFKFTKARENRVSAMETQRQIMINVWKEEGLSDEEIELRVQEISPKNASKEKGSPSPINMIQRVVTGRGQGGGFH